MRANLFTVQREYAFCYVHAASLSTSVSELMHREITSPILHYASMRSSGMILYQVIGIDID